MNRRNETLSLLLLCALLGLFVWVNVFTVPGGLQQWQEADATVDPKETESFVQENPDAVDTGIFDTYEKGQKLVSVAHAAKALALLFAADNAFDTAVQQEETEWFAPYLQYLAACNIWNDLSISFASAENIAVTGDAQKKLLVACEQYVERDRLEPLYLMCEAEDKAVEQEAWWAFFLALAEAFQCQERIRQLEFSIYATVGQQKELDGTVYTDLGIIGCLGMNLTKFVDCRMQGAVIGRELIYCCHLEGQEVIYQNAYVIQMEPDVLAFFWGNMTKRYELAGSGLQLPERDQQPTGEGCIADVVLRDGRISNLYIKQPQEPDRVLAATEQGVYFEKQGWISFKEGFRMYRSIGESLQEGNRSELIIGYTLQDFWLESGQICAAVTKQEFVPDQIRVLLKTTGFSDIYHDMVQVSAPSGCRVTVGEDIYQVNPGVPFTLYASDEQWQDRCIIVTPIVEEEELSVLSLQRAAGAPSYKGRIEIWQKCITAEDGSQQWKILLVNELPLEDYLKKVVPSEMPASYGLESAKVQAVCARSYAYNQMQGGQYAELGAHVDDSISFQVYNNSGENAISSQGVAETAGELLTFQGQVVTAYYFSTSPGITTDAGIWNDSPENSPFLYEHLVTEPVLLEDVEAAANLGALAASLKEEDTFLRFITTVQENAVEKDFPWYRWNCRISLEELTERVNRSLAARSRNNPALTLVLQEDGSFVGQYIESIGEVLSMEVLERSSGGVVSKLLLTGTEASVILCKQSNIRSVLGDSAQIYNNTAETGIGGKALLPSAFFALTDLKDEDGSLIGYQIYGGGYGHGLGMSQNGAKALADLGYGYQEILRFFYLGCEIQKI